MKAIGGMQPDGSTCRRPTTRITTPGKRCRAYCSATASPTPTSSTCTPSRPAEGRKGAAVNLAKVALFQALRALAAVSAGRLNFDNLFVVARKGAAAPLAMKHLVLISCHGVEDEGDRILALAEWMGVPTRQIAIGDSTTAETLGAKIGGQGCVVISVQALETLRQWIEPDALRDLLTSRCARVLVFTAARTETQENLVSWLTAGAVATQSSPKMRQGFHLAEAGRPFSRTFAGQSFAAADGERVPAFELGEAGSSVPDIIMLADGKPVFLRMQRGACEMLLLAASRLPRLDAPLSRDAGIAAHYVQSHPAFDCLAPLVRRNAAGRRRRPRPISLLTIRCCGRITGS